MILILFAAVGSLFWFMTLTGRDLAASGNILWTMSYVLRTLLLSLVLGILTGGMLHRLFGWIARRESKEIVRKENALMTRLAGWKAWQIWLLSGCLIALSWLPCYLAYYPGICAYDTPVQLEQIFEGAYNEHHPIAHTLLIAAAVSLGKNVFGDANTGIAIFILLQMLVLAGSMAGGVVFLARRHVSAGRLLVLQLLCMFYPFHKYMSISMTKDVLFTAFFLVQLLALLQCVSEGQGKLKGYDFIFCGCSVGMQLFRNNGRYALLLLTGVLILALLFDRKGRSCWKKITLNCLAALVIGTLFLKALSGATHAVEGDKREMLSVPIQQLARCMIYHGGVGVLEEDSNTIDEQDKALINEFLLNESYRQYDPRISDPVKRHTNTYVVRYRTAEFVKTYLKLMRRYPGDFINAVLALDAGYLYPGDESHAGVNENKEFSGLGYVQTRWDEMTENYGLYKDSKWEGLHEYLEKWADENAYLKIPVLKYFFMPGILLWAYLLLLLYMLMCRNYRGCIPLTLAFGYFATLFLGPVVQLRYLYPLMTAFPFLLWSASGKEN
ncbi:MAG: DUF6020 family protein [Acetatifactor sp.]